MSLGLRSAAIFRRYGLFIGPRQMPERSGLPSAVFGAGAERFGLPSGKRGTPGVAKLIHCAAAGAESRDDRAATTASIGFVLIWSLPSRQLFLVLVKEVKDL